MERSFVITKESKYFQGYEEYKKYCEEQRIFVVNFLNEKGITASQYMIRGTGFINVPFKEDAKSIKFSIIPTEEDLEKFGNKLTKPNEYGLCSFKKSSTISKEFAKRCIDEQIVINLYAPRIGDSFKSLGFRGCGYQQFEHKNVMYLKVTSEYLEENDTPVGFNEIKLSEYYLTLEEYEKFKEVK